MMIHTKINSWYYVAKRIRIEIEIDVLIIAIVRTAVDVEQLTKIIYHYIIIDNRIRKKIICKNILLFSIYFYQQNSFNLKYFQTIFLLSYEYAEK
jgi:hypothetical protein